MKLSQADGARLMAAHEKVLAAMRAVFNARTEGKTMGALENLGSAKQEFDDLVSSLTEPEA